MQISHAGLAMAATLLMGTAQQLSGRSI